jgi:periplasmic protein TonB
MARVTNQIVFRGSLLPEGQARWGSFSAGLGLEFLFLAAIVIIPMLVPQKLELVHRYWTTPIAAPVIEAWKPQPPPPPVKPTIVKHVVVKPVKPPEVKPEPVAIVELPKPKIISPVFSSPIAKPVAKKKQSAPNPDLPDVAKVFPTQAPSVGSSAIPTIKKPREAVQTGGFGDPNGVAANAQAANHSPNIATKGGYDMPNGPGFGNGTGGAKGDRGVVASTGFGNGVATGTNSGGNRGAVQQGGFADEHAVAPAPKVKQAAVSSNSKPVEILFKPKPQYTDEARTKKIEGEVLLQIVFTAAGDVKVQRVVQGLGYGLDDSAQSAARQIRFKPAQQGGEPVDTTAIVHIVFQLAY